MPDPTRTELLRQVLEAKAAMPDASTRQIAAATGATQSTVSRALSRFRPVAEELIQVRRDEAVAAYQAIQFKTLARMDALLDDEPSELAKVATEKGGVTGALRNLSVVAGIAGEKALLFAGQPTQITATTHEHRLSLPDLVSRLARLAGTNTVSNPPIEATARPVTALPERNPSE